MDLHEKHPRPQNLDRPICTFCIKYANKTLGLSNSKRSLLPGKQLSEEDTEYPLITRQGLKLGLGHGVQGLGVKVRVSGCSGSRV